MGMGIARSLIRAGIPTYGFDLNLKACDQLLQEGAKVAANNAASWASELDIILLVVVNGAQIENILFGGKTPLVRRLKTGTVIVLHSTVAARASERLCSSS